MNNNLKMIDIPIWLQLAFAPANSAAGSSICDDGERFIYYMISATNFWRYDTWHDCWQQLASPPGGTIAAGSKIIYTKSFGEQLNGVVYGSVFSFQCSGSAITFYRYNIATNIWSAALSVATLPAAFGTDSYLSYPSPELNGWEGGYHSGVLRTITATADAVIGATSISVSALPQALLSGTILNFGTFTSPKWAVLTAGAALNATSITVAALQAQVSNTNAAYYYDSMYLIGNNASQFYRYTFSTNLWSTTSANGGNPALPAIAGAAGVGCAIKFLPGIVGYENNLVIIRGGTGSQILAYNFESNTNTIITPTPNTEGYGAGTCVAASLNSSGKQSRLFIEKDITMRIYEFDIIKGRLNPIAYQGLVASGAAVAGDKMCSLKSPDGQVDFLYIILSTSNAFLRVALI